MLGQGRLTLTFQRTGHCTWQWVKDRAEATQATTSPWLGQPQGTLSIVQGGAWSSPSMVISLVNTLILEVSGEGYGSEAGDMGHPRFTPQCHWGSSLIGRRRPGEDKREKAGLDSTWASAALGEGATQKP